MYVAVIFFATPPIPIYLIGKGDDILIITDTMNRDIVTLLGDGIRDA